MIDTIVGSVPAARRCLRILFHTGAATAVVLVLSTSGAYAEKSVVVNSALGGEILGYDIDQNGTEGILSENLYVGNDKFEEAIETFSQKTGKILKIVKKITTFGDFRTLGVVGTSLGLVQQDQEHKFLHRLPSKFDVLDPLGGNAITGSWTPPFKKKEYIVGVSESQGFPNTAVFAFDGRTDADQTFVFSSDVANNTFGPIARLDDDFSLNDSPVMALNTTTNNAIVATAVPVSELAIVDLSTASVSTFTGLGGGHVQGIGVDSADNIACTTTLNDYSVEFYDLTTQTGTIEPIPGAGGELQAGTNVQFDPVNRLFLIAQPITSQGGGSSSILEYDPSGNFITSVNGLTIAEDEVNGVGIAFNPNTRRGFVQSAPSQLESFAY